MRCEADAQRPRLQGDVSVHHVGAFRERHEIDSSEFLAIFAGSLTMSAGIMMYVQVAERLKDTNGITILLVGDGSDRQQLEKEIASKKMNNIRVIHPLLPEDVPEVQAAADVLLLSLSGDSAQNAAPSKQVSYMFSGRPIVASISSEGTPARIIVDADAGFVLPPDDPQAVADLLIKLADDPSSLSKLGENARRYAVDNFSKRIVLPRLADLIESVAR